MKRALLVFFLLIPSISAVPEIAYGGLVPVVPPGPGEWTWTFAGESENVTGPALVEVQPGFHQWQLINGSTVETGWLYVVESLAPAIDAAATDATQARIAAQDANSNISRVIDGMVDLAALLPSQSALDALISIDELEAFRAELISDRAPIAQDAQEAKEAAKNAKSAANGQIAIALILGLGLAFSLWENRKLRKESQRQGEVTHTIATHLGLNPTEPFTDEDGNAFRVGL